MTEIRRGPVAAFLLGAVTIAGMAAIIAGIFGMHVMTGHHTMHLQGTGQAASTAVSVTDAHLGHEAAAHSPDHRTVMPAAPGASGVLTPGPASWSCCAECPSVETRSTACVPSAKTGNLAAPEPPQGALASTNAAVPDCRVKVTFAYDPATPSPGELSISRT